MNVKLSHHNMWLVKLRIGILKKQINEGRFFKPVSIINHIIVSLKTQDTDINDVWKEMLITQLTMARDCITQPIALPTQQTIDSAIYHLECAKDTLLKNAWFISRDRGQLLIAKRLMNPSGSIGTLEILPNNILHELSLKLLNESVP